jgi:uncharacterized protein YoxC
MVNLETTNWLLGIVAVASALQVILLIGLAVSGYKMYARVMKTMEEVEARHLIPLHLQIDGILNDVQDITARISLQTERVDQAISGTIDRVDETAERVRHSVRGKVSEVAGIVRGVRAIITSILATDSKTKSPAEAGGRA